MVWLSYRRLMIPVYRSGLALVLYLLALGPGGAVADETPPTVDSTTLQAEVPSFYVRAVTGPLAGKSVCYVCRHGDRPVVVVLLRDLDQDATALLKDLDQTVNAHRADGLRCFAVLLTNTPQRDLGRLQTLAFDEKISIPLALASETSTAGSTLEFPRDSLVSVVAYESRRVVQKFSFKSGACDVAARSAIIAASKKLCEAEMQ